jgi:hypothetical protein
MSSEHVCEVCSASAVRGTLSTTAWHRQSMKTSRTQQRPGCDTVRARARWAVCAGRAPDPGRGCLTLTSARVAALFGSLTNAARSLSLAFSPSLSFHPFHTHTVNAGFPHPPPSPARSSLLYYITLHCTALLRPLAFACGNSSALPYYLSPAPVPLWPIRPKFPAQPGHHHT